MLAHVRVLVLIVDAPPALLNSIDIPGGNFFAVLVLLMAPVAGWSAPEVDHTKWCLADAEVLVKPVPTPWRRRHQTTRTVLQDLDGFRVTRLPGSLAKHDRPIER